MIVCRPLYDSYDPPARGKLDLTNYLREKKDAELKRRIAWRDAIIKSKQDKSAHKSAHKSAEE